MDVLLGLSVVALLCLGVFFVIVILANFEDWMVKHKRKFGAMFIAVGVLNIVVGISILFQELL